MISFPNIKVNLGLNVLRRRADSYHDLNTVMLPVAFCDILEILPLGDEMEFSQSGLAIPGDPVENLVVKAYELFSRRTGRKGARIHLHKVVPPGSGLGGGSSDAAFTLLMLNELFGTGLSQEELAEMSSQLGSDCPFFIRNRPAHAAGRGEILEDVHVNLRDKSLVLVMPGIPVSTRWAYSAIHPREAEISPEEAVKKDISAWKEVLVNDFEVPVFREYPAIREIRDRMYELGALYASMSGSGSAVFGIFQDDFTNISEEFTAYATWQGKLF